MLPIEILIVFIFVLSLVFSAIFSGIETAIISINKAKITHSAEQGDKRALTLLELLQKIELLISSCLIGNNIVLIVASVMVGTFLNMHGMHYGLTEFLFVSAQTALFLMFGEIFPKAYFRANANRMVLVFFPFLKGMLTLFKPFLYLIDRVNGRIFQIKTSHTIAITREEIEHMFHMSGKEGVLDDEGTGFISDIFEFKHTTAREIFVPTINIISCELRKPLSHAAKLIMEHGYSRIPIFERRVDNIIGFVSARHLLNARKTDTIEKLLQRTQYIPLTKKISEAYLEMKSLKLPLVFVVNEYGAVSGMITLEDIAEEIVGEIQTLDHPEEASCVQLAPKSFILDGMMNIDDVNKLFKIKIEKKGFETIGGYMTFKFDRIPLTGEKINLNDLTITAVEVTRTLVRKVRFDFH